MVNEADKLDLVDPERLRQAFVTIARAGPGWRCCASLLDRQTFTLTDSVARATSSLPHRTAGGASSASHRPERRQRLQGRFPLAGLWPWSWRPTACAITERRHSRHAIACAIKLTWRRASRRCALRTHR